MWGLGARYNHGANMGHLNHIRSSVLIAFLVFPSASPMARDDGRYSASPLKPWFDNLRSSLGPCCSDADGVIVADPDWEFEGRPLPRAARRRMDHGAR